MDEDTAVCCYGRQAVSYQDVQKLPEDIGYSYYYKVNQVWFCCQSDLNAAEDPSACTYSGWYYPNYPSGEDVYLPVDENSKEAATHYISAAEYTLTREPVIMILFRAAILKPLCR